MTSLNKFQYNALESLSSIRVLILLPGSGTDALACRLLEVHIEDKVDYEALSYVWGDKTDKHAILCDGREIAVTPNLAAALWRFRMTESPRTLWVDSVCIDQASNKEKSHQVAMMGDIYRNASSVLIWLGDEDEFEDMAKVWECSQILRDRVYPRRKEITARWEHVGKENIRSIRNSDEVTAALNIPSPDSEIFKATAKLLSRPWFSRAWTFQESFLARKKTFVCGSYTMNEIEMHSLLNCLFILQSCTDDTRYFDTSRIAHSVSAIDNNKRSSMSTLHALLRWRRGASCSDARDSIYSLLGATAHKTDIIPDYDKSVESVWAEATAYMMRSDASLSVLGDVEASPSSTLPSWVPDWRKERKVYYELLESVYSCTGSSIPAIQLPEDSRELTLKGVELDRIVGIIPVDKSRARATVLQFPQQDEKFGVYKHTKEPLSSAMFRTMMFDRAFLRRINRSKRWDEEQRTAILQIMKDAGNPEEKQTFTSLYVDILGNTQDKVLITTQKARLGMTTLGPQVGDTVALLLGGRVPLILRPDEDKYTFVCQSYVHGFMDGEGLREIRKNEDPTYDDNDISWLQRLHEGPLPFKTREFTIK